MHYLQTTARQVHPSCRPQQPPPRTSRSPVVQARLRGKEVLKFTLYTMTLAGPQLPFTLRTGPKLWNFHHGTTSQAQERQREGHLYVQGERLRCRHKSGATSALHPQKCPAYTEWSARPYMASFISFASLYFTQCSRRRATTFARSPASLWDFVRHSFRCLMEHKDVHFVFMPCSFCIVPYTLTACHALT